MPNEFEFETYFLRKDIEDLLTSDMKQLCVYGELVLKADGTSYMLIKADGFNGEVKISSGKDGCPTPCPTAVTA